jgi:NDP-sugar pyrophosphorylase family protein
MRRSRITITLDSEILNKIDRLVNNQTIRNRSHAIEYILDKYTQSNVHKAIILAGGVGTQLRPYTYELPKSMLPVNGKPILEHLIIQLKNNNVTDIIVAISYLGEKIKEYFQDGKKWGVKISYSEEKNSLLTGGAVKKLKEEVSGDTFLVVHGDILTDFSFEDFIDFHNNQNTLVTAALTTSAKPTEFGQIKLHGAHLTEFYSHTEDHGTQSHLINTGIYAFNPNIFAEFPNDKDSFALEDIIKNLISKRQVTGFVFEGSWFDVGNPQNYEKAIKMWKKR